MGRQQFCVHVSELVGLGNPCELGMQHPDSLADLYHGVPVSVFSKIGQAQHPILQQQGLGGNHGVPGY